MEINARPGLAIQLVNKYGLQKAIENYNNSFVQINQKPFTPLLNLKKLVY